jgi:hypothetical protein
MRRDIAARHGAAHDAAQRRGDRRSTDGWRVCLVESAIGIALVVISAVLILGIVRVVSANLNIGK